MDLFAKANDTEPHYDAGRIALAGVIFFWWYLRRASDHIDDVVTAEWWHEQQSLHKRPKLVGFLEY